MLRLEKSDKWQRRRGWVECQRVPPLTAPTWQEAIAFVDPTGVRYQAVRTDEPAIARHACRQDQRTRGPPTPTRLTRTSSHHDAKMLFYLSAPGGASREIRSGLVLFL